MKQVLLHSLRCPLCCGNKQVHNTKTKKLKILCVLNKKIKKEITLNSELTGLFLICQLKLTGLPKNRDVAAFLAFYRTETGLTVTIEIH